MLGISTASGRVTGVVTGDGEIATGVVVNACGPWGDRIGRMAGVDYPITFSREHEAIFDAPEGFEDFPVISDVPQRLYCRPYVGGKVLVGDGWPKKKEPVDPETYDDGTDDAHVSKMVPKLLNRAAVRSAPTLTQPNYGGAYVTGYSGVYDITEDWYPIVGEEELGGYYSCFGGSGHGFKIGPAIGEALADMIAGRSRRSTSRASPARASPRAARSARSGGRETAHEHAAPLDPITFEVIRNALVAATDEMVLTLRRSAYSTNIKTRSDFSCAFFDAELRAVAQGFTQPVHLGSMVEQVPQAVRSYGPENLGPGDVIITNEPFPSGVHLNDVSLISPVFADGELLGYVANLAHHVDVGGGAPASIGAFREVFQEGVIIPPVKVVEAGRIVDDVFALILAQIRSKHETAGDFRAQIAANATGARQARGARRAPRARDDRRRDGGAARLHRAAHARRARGAASRRLRVDGHRSTPTATPTSPCASARASRSRPTASRSTSTGSDPQRRAPVNSTFAQTFSACAYALKCLIDPDLPVNDGFYRLVHLDAPRGSVTNCTWPSPVVGGWETQTRLVDIIFRALLPALPAALPAGTKAMMCHAGFGGVDPVTNEYVCFLETFGGGYGGRLASDGPDAVQTHGQNTENAPVEETELNYPVRVVRLSLVDDSDGAGPVPRRARAAQGLPLRPADDVHRAVRPDERRPGGRLRRPRRQGRGVRADPGRRGDAARRQGDGGARGRRRRQLPHLRRRRVRAARGARPRAGAARRARGEGERRARP